MPKIVNTRELIIEKAAELFNLHGFSGCSVSNIMQATGLKKGGIYNHFKSKEEIAIEAFNFSMAQIFKRFRERLDLDKTPLDKLNSVIDVYVNLIAKPMLKGGCPIFNTAVDASDSHPVLKERAREAINSLLRYVELKIEDGIKSGDFKENVNPAQLASILMINMEGAIIMSRVNTDSKYVDNAASFLRNYIKTSIAK